MGFYGTPLIGFLVYLHGYRYNLTPWMLKNTMECFMHLVIFYILEVLYNIF